LLLLRLGRAQNDFDQWIGRHNEFHDAICSRGGSPRMIAYVHRLRTAVEPYLRMALGTPRASGIVEEHRQLIDALRSGDPQAAEDLMREHIRGTAFELIALMDESAEMAAPIQATSKHRRKSQSVT
jgi:DNA-binding GntR family transcriptional regulator